MPYNDYFVVSQALIVGGMAWTSAKLAIHGSNKVYRPARLPLFDETTLVDRAVNGDTQQREPRAFVGEMIERGEVTASQTYATQDEAVAAARNGLWYAKGSMVHLDLAGLVTISESETPPRPRTQRPRKITTNRPKAQT
ncbi:hypothetical protein [Tardiphaga sp.]|uniref:hypothetical protein n=1 Tax=Tardiphaga sp. TaxID=1926292 RepID=UPI0025CD1151|nr:hypothetical protein [Tardiphaga sp.]